MMKKKIFCKFLRRQAEKQDFQSYPGELGKRIFQNISKEAWTQWQTKQTMIINENQLNMTNISHRQYLEKQMIHFLFSECK